MFHGKIAAGGGEGNHIKSIQTRSRNKIIFDDQQGSVFVADASGNSYLMDGKGNIEIKAPGNITPLPLGVMSSLMLPVVWQ